MDVKDEATDELIFKEDVTSSPFALRPLFLTLGKEVNGNLEDVRKAVVERQGLQEINVSTSSRQYSVKLSKADMSSYD